MDEREKMTPEDFLGKVEWEGGIDEALDYGLRASDLDGSDPELSEAWATLERLHAEGEKARRVVNDKIEALL